jgi:hypothetical protein
VQAIAFEIVTRVDSQSALPRSFLAAVFLDHQASYLLVFAEDESPAVAEGDFFEQPSVALVGALLLGVGGVSFLVEPVQVRFVVEEPFFDGLPGNK